MIRSISLLERVASFDNIALAYRNCARGKRWSHGFQKSVFATGEILIKIREDLLSGNYRWRGYREFTVHDPKCRLVMAAPFLDRVVHHAIHQIIAPYFESDLNSGAYACVKGRGNRKAVIDLCHALRRIGPKRYCIKLDVQKYFDSISHSVLMSILLERLRDSSLSVLLKTLLASYPAYAARGFGISIGNLTSQLFANVYLASADSLVQRILPSDEYYCRYMDDLVLIGKTKSGILEIAATVIEHVQTELKLSIPFQKRIHLAGAPIPFLGFVIDHTGYRILMRNERRYAKHERRLMLLGALPSRIAQSKQSHESWKNLAQGRMCL